MSAVKRILDATSSDLLAMSGAELAESIRLAEGRTVAAEVLCDAASPVDGVSHGEVAAAFGADIVTLDHFDPLYPSITGVYLPDAESLHGYARLLGRPVGINLIVAAGDATTELGGRAFTAPNAERVAEQGARVLFVYVRPKQGGTHDEMVRRIGAAHLLLDDRVLLVGVPSFSLPAPRDPAGLTAFRDQIRALIEAGCGGIALPMPGSKQGWTAEAAGTLTDGIHAAGALSWLFVTHSVEGAQPDVMTALALEAKHIGCDAVRLDEAGLSGMPSPENVFAFSMALRGARHTYRRMASSILR